MIEFNKVSNESYFIKNLLYSTYLPLVRTVRENDYIIRDRVYIYKCNIIKCINSGYIMVKNSNLNIDEYPEYMLRKSDDTKIKDGQVYYQKSGNNFKKIVGKRGDGRNPKASGWLEENVAEYRILGEYYFGEKNGKFCTNFLSSSEGYDYKTHEHLGKYLRSLRDMYGLNLMPLYNCFSNELLRNIHINPTNISKTSRDYQTKVYKVPIRFNTDYTIYMENLGMTSFAPAFIRHGTLLNLSNNRFGNGLDATNKFIKLHHNDVIHNVPNMRFKNPIKLRFDNIPKNKVVHYSNYTYTEIPSQYYQDYYRLNYNANPAFRKVYCDYTVDEETGETIPPESWITIDYNNGRKNYCPGYKYIIDEGDGESLKANDDVIASDDLILPIPSYELYESINPSLGVFNDADINKSYKKCPEDETFFNVHIFNNDKDKYYTYDDVNKEYEQCNEYSVYDPDEIYYYIDKEKDQGWYELIDGELVKTQDTFIDTDKKYYKKELTEIPFTFNYDITEDNCSMYDYIEDDLYLLIQVPSSYNKNIVILEGNYLDTSKERYYDEKKFELFSSDKLDSLFTDHLILTETHTKKLRPFSSTLIQFLLWHALCNLDTINNDMDRLEYSLSTVATFNSRYSNNYWTNYHRSIVFDYANTFPKMYVRDNLGYVTTDIEKVIKLGDNYFDGDVLSADLDEDTSDSRMIDEED